MGRLVLVEQHNQSILEQFLYNTVKTTRQSEIFDCIIESKCFNLRNKAIFTQLATE